jgi:reactive intermediate/imine deaminase
MRTGIITPVATANAPAAGGQYVQAVKHGGLVYVSGQLPVAPDGSHKPEADFETQARQALANLLAVTEAAGASVATLLKVTVYLVDVANWPRFNAVYAQMLGDVRPARTVVPVSELHYGYLVEIDAIAACHE